MTVETPAVGVTAPPAAGPKKLPDHGTLFRAIGNRRYGIPRCSCSRCRPVERAYSKRRKYLIHMGKPLLVDAWPTRQHLLRMRAADDSYAVIAEEIGLSRSTLGEIAGGRVEKVRRDTERLVLALKPGEFQNDMALIPAVGSTRRLRALFALGHTLVDISNASGVVYTYTSEILTGRATFVTRVTARRLRRVYAELSQRQGESSRNRKRAAREGWKDPVWWEDWGSIDDPDFDPDMVELELNRDELGALRRGEVEHLASYGCEPEVIAERLGLGLSTVRALVNEWRSGERRDRKKVAS